MKFIEDIFKGILIGAGGILPGISSGVLCVIFGIYEKLIDSVLNFFKDIRKNLKFLLPIVIGGIIGVILFSKILQMALYKYPLQTKSIFIGLILGGVITLFKDINTERKFKINDIIYIAISMLIGICLVILENRINNFSVESTNYIYLVLSGFLMSIGIVVPGVSSTIILMILGTYSLYLNSIATLYFPVLIPIGIGLILGSLIFMKIIKYLLDRFYINTMYSIIGFTIGSIFILVPEVNSLIEFMIVILGIWFGFYMIKKISK